MRNNEGDHSLTFSVQLFEAFFYKKKLFSLCLQIVDLHKIKSYEKSFKKRSFFYAFVSKA